MLHEFADCLRARDTAVQRFKLIFTHRAAPPSEIVIGTSFAERNAERFLALVRERLERTELPAPYMHAERVYAKEFIRPLHSSRSYSAMSCTTAKILHHTLQSNRSASG